MYSNPVQRKTLHLRTMPGRLQRRILRLLLARLRRAEGDVLLFAAEGAPFSI
jgi:hypothetical protein